VWEPPLHLIGNSIPRLPRFFEIDPASLGGVFGVNEFSLKVALKASRSTLSLIAQGRDDCVGQSQ